MQEDKRYRKHEYFSPFTNWYESSSVRTKPQRIIDEIEICEKEFFPSQNIPILSHPLIQGKDVKFRKQIIIQRLYSYLELTNVLEHQVVNHVAHQIISGNLIIELPPQMIIDAQKIYIDEAYHSLFSADMKSQIIKLTGVPELSIEKPSFIFSLEKILENLPTDIHELAKTFSVIVSETLISSILRETPRNSNMISAVKNMILDHAQDEKLHHAYFSYLLHILWPQLSTDQQEIIGPLFPELIFAFLKPDLTNEKSYLNRLGFSMNQSNLIVEESYPHSQVVLSIQSDAKPTINHLKKNGILDLPYVIEAFNNFGFKV
ncbi:diiron oxygenase [Nostoc sp. UIC 10890]